MTSRPAGDPPAPGARGRGTVVRWRLTLPETGAAGAAGAEPAPGRSFEATDPADAAGRALHYLLAERGWQPGPALSGW